MTGPPRVEYLGKDQQGSTVHKIMLPGNFGKEWSLFKKSLVSLKYDFTAWAKGCRWKSKNADIFSM